MMKYQNIESKIDSPLGDGHWELLLPKQAVFWATDGFSKEYLFRHASTHEPVSREEVVRFTSLS